MSLPEKAFPVSWDQFHRDARILAERIGKLGREFDVIVSITRGGLIPAAILARELNIRVVETVGLASYHDYANQGDMQVLKGLPPDIAATGGAKVLVVDDLTDTGATVTAVRRMLPNAYYACVYAKPQGASLVDSFVTEVGQDTWIYLPWDMGFTFQEPLSGPSR